MHQSLRSLTTHGHHRFSRRAVAGALAGSAAGLARRGSLAQPATPAASPAGEWSFTDDAGKTVTLPAPPTRIVADLNVASALWDFGVRPIAVSGWTVATDAAWGNVDRSTPVINAGSESGEPDLEQLLALAPDLFVTIVWAPDDPNEHYNWTFTSPEQYRLAESIMPVIGISGTGSADVNMERIAELAASVGADLETPELIAARDDYTAAVADFRALAEEKADLVTAFVGITPDAEFVANWPDWADLTMYHTLGLNIVTPDVPAGQYWDELSPEQANKYPADVIFQSARAEGLSLDEVRASPIYGALPAVVAGQLGTWNQDFILSYQGLTAALTNVIDTLATAEKVIEA